MALVLGVDPQWRSQPVWESLVQIAGCDPGLESVVHAYISGWGARVYYKQQVKSASVNRLKEIVEHSKYVVLYGVRSGFVNPTDGAPIIKTGGGSITYHNADGSASIYVDVDDAYGQHYLAPGHGGTVYDSLPTIVYHELAHAYYHIIGKNPPAYRDKEILAGEMRTNSAGRWALTFSTFTTTTTQVMESRHSAPWIFRHAKRLRGFHGAISPRWHWDHRSPARSCRSGAQSVSLDD